MSTVVFMPAKRPDLGQGLNLEQPPEKRLKLDDPQPGELDDAAVELQSSVQSSESNSSGDSSIQTVEDSIGYCTICDDNVHHSTWECPDRSKGIGLCCSVCLGPCKNIDEHRDCQVEMIKYCVVCSAQASHWGEDCPHVPKDDEGEVDLSTLTDDYYGF